MKVREVLQRIHKLHFDYILSQRGGGGEPTHAINDELSSDI